jgi:hypothetical protein
MNKSRFLGNALLLLTLSVAPIGCGDDASDDTNTGGTGGAGASGGTGGTGATGGSAGGGGDAGSGGNAGSGGVAGSSGAAGSGGTGGAAIDCASGDILAYEYGNQITGSELHVQADGTVVHEERICCPPEVNDQNAPALEAAALTELKGWIDAAKSGTISVSDGTPTSLGSSAGTLAACSADGTAIVIHNVIRNAAIGQPDRVESNTAAEAAEIRAFVSDIVDEDMP